MVVVTDGTICRPQTHDCLNVIILQKSVNSREPRKRSTLARTAGRGRRGGTPGSVEERLVSWSRLHVAAAGRTGGQAKRDVRPELGRRQAVGRRLGAAQVVLEDARLALAKA